MIMTKMINLIKNAKFSFSVSHPNCSDALISIDLLGILPPLSRSDGTILGDTFKACLSAGRRLIYNDRVLPGSQKQLLKKYVNAVLTAPTSLGLTAAKDAAEFWERHVLDALKVLSLVPDKLHGEKLRVIDVGSGNGIPGIPIAIALPNWEIYLVESSNKKSGFLDMFCKFNGITNVHVLPHRAETLAHEEEHRARYDLAFARALGKLPVALELSVPFLKQSGFLVIPHGGSYKLEIERSKNAFKELGAAHQKSIPYSLNEEVTFTALFILKQLETPDRYPRKPGIPHKRPL
jgi:16S rRNA (guanine527-N7)-methyltransferase